MTLTSTLHPLPSSPDEARPRHDPAADPMPYNPNGVGRCFPAPTDTPSLADHLAAVRLDREVIPTRQLPPTPEQAARSRYDERNRERHREASRNRYYARKQLRRICEGGAR